MIDSETGERLLHKGGLLGDLPAFGKKEGGMSSPSASSRQRLRRDGADEDVDATLTAGVPTLSPTSASRINKKKSKSSKDKNHLSKNKKKRNPDGSTSASSEQPEELLCMLTKKPMRTAVKSPYQHVFEKSAIEAWFTQYGNVCPITAMPLSLTDLAPDASTQAKIDGWKTRGLAVPAASGPAAAAAPVLVPETAEAKTRSVEGAASAKSSSRDHKFSLASAAAVDPASTTESDVYDF